MNQRGEDPFRAVDGKPGMVRGVAVNRGSIRLAEMASVLGFETFWIEMEHGPADFERAESLCQAIEADARRIQVVAKRVEGLLEFCETRVVAGA